MSCLTIPQFPRTLTVALGLVLSLCCRQGFAQPPSLSDVLQPLISDHEGQVAIAVKDLASGETFTHRADVPMPTASLIKVAVMVEAYRQADAGKLDLSQMVTLAEADKVPGSGILTTHFSAGMQLSLRDAVRLMIAYSDNTGTNLVVDRISLPATTAAMEQLGLPNTKLHAKVFRADTSIFPERSQEFGLGSTTAAEMLQLLERLHRGELASEAATRDMLEHLRACQDKNMLPRLLPAGTVIGHKTGSVNAVRTAAGIIETEQGPLVIVVLTAENEDRRWTDENAAEILIARIAQSAFEHFRPSAANAPPDTPRELRLGANGWLVEALQRTLNARATASPNLTVDGDFGPATQSAVLAFQKSRQLPETGIVESATWQALGPLITGDEVITDPAHFDLQVPEKLPADALDGAPFVTCKAWAVGDADSGELLFGSEADKSLEIASTTKLMTAWIVLKRAAENPAILEELVVVSPRAAATPGSTANLKAGERLPVGELLYGLLLPSGNDAATALAEHFGARCDPPESSPQETDPLPRFVAEMNRTAAAMGLAGTQYRNPHGLSAEEHRSTARDLMRLAAAIVQDGRMLEYAQSRRHIGRLESEAGYVRYELWSNTNRLLDTEGYLGLKTGTTTPAGACLVSVAQHDNHRLIAVVLGATSPDARYTDTRNLFRWVWQQRASQP